MLLESGWSFPDLVPVAQATALFAPLVFLPGYVAAWLANLFEVRDGSLARRIAVAIPLSVSLAPVLVYLFWRYGSIHSVWHLYEVLAIVFAGTVAADAFRAYRGRLPKVFTGKRAWAVGGVAALAWTALAMGSLLDLRHGGKQYFSVTAFDYKTRIPMTASIALTSRLPAESPFLNPGHTTALRYHYFWPMVCGFALAADGALNPSIEARDVVTAGTIWAGVALLGAIALYLRFFYGVESSDWKSYALGFALLGVGGLDIFPVLAHDTYTFLHWRAIYSTVAWWNEQITGWLDAMLWVPHHIVALVCGLMAFLLLWRAAEPLGRRWRGVAVALAAAALASAGGSSIYVTFVGGLCLAVWMLYLAKTREYSSVFMFALAGGAALLLAAPFLRETLASGATSAAGPAGRLPVSLTIRGFSPIRWASYFVVLPAPLWHILSLALRLILLPVNYFLELGFFFYVALIQWRRFRSGKMSRPDTAAAVLLVTSVVACTFLRSNQISSNDLGWRGFMIAQFFLLLWAAGVLRNREDLSRPQKRLLTALLIVGVVTTAYDLVLLRGFTPMLDARPGLIQHKLDPDGRLGARTYALAQGYDWIRRNTAAADLVQTNPANMTYEFGLYASRRAAVLGECEGFAASGETCAALERAVEPAFCKAPPQDGLAAVCRAAPVKMVVVQDSDPVWTDAASWVWKADPVYANQFERIFACH